ncbi:MAG TPA: methylenetetrahydrofolate--tRNA-(uracil(54)-C(5))-methyltransferase (FADH(2)-oxidizing) TrmFO [Ruminococcaceae bacterium]|nr:methylenetetrahydrofolate--tRNA-(uracil(54)-C(5))-methyltransferase (FADH(2)-oxidizing) TrmFO [Oscillospiraceae bacterium]
MIVTVAGAGLAGCEAAFALAERGIKVVLCEMKPQKYTPAHKYSGFAELVCSNSLKASRIESAAGLLKEEMRILGSLTMKAAEKTSVAAGGALAVDREKFSDYITNIIKIHSNIEIKTGELTEIPQGNCIIATGPLTSDKLADAIKKLCGSEYLSFFDAAAPIVTAASLDFDKVFYAARYGRGDDDYINCPFDKERYELFYNELVNAESVPLKQFEKRDFKVYEGCMPVEVMAKRGIDTLRYGPLKPVGLTDPKTGRRPYAVVQLRKENSEGSLYNIVGFQTNLKFGEQKRVFSLIPGLENAEFVRYGVMHRNTFINSPKLLDSTFNFKADRRIYFAGQITGVEGYIESAASGILAGINMANQLENKPKLVLPKDTMLGALAGYISDETVADFQPMGCNMGILPSLDDKIKDKTKRYEAISLRALDSLKSCLNK